MANSGENDMSALDGMGGVSDDVNPRMRVGFKGPEDEEPPVQIETHERHHRNDPRHVDLNQDEYTPQEVARLLGTSLEVVMQAIRGGELKAERQGQNVVCIQHGDVVEWLNRRGPGI